MAKTDWVRFHTCEVYYSDQTTISSDFPSSPASETSRTPLTGCTRTASAKSKWVFCIGLIDCASRLFGAHKVEVSCLGLLSQLARQPPRATIEVMLHLVQLVFRERTSGLKDVWISVDFGCIRFDDAYRRVVDC